MASRHYPIEDAGAATTWSYNADDSISQIVDPREAITTFTNNIDPRGLTTRIEYTQPPNNPTVGSPGHVPDTPTVDFGYDNLGNRTSMGTDGVSEITYAYDALSRLTGETVNFDALSNNLTIGYTYNLAGGLKSITDPFGVDVNYAHDKTGRLTAVTGEPFGQNTTGNYASGIQYRAFGGVKRMTYDMPAGDSHIDLQYDNSMRVIGSSVTKANLPNDHALAASYSYYADGRVSGKDDQLNDAWDRASTYDFAGRLRFNQFGIDGPTNKRVYEQTLTYNAFSQMTGRETLYWGNNQPTVAGTYVNGRKTSPNAPTYDAAGNITFQRQNSEELAMQSSTHDAAGRLVAVRDRWKLGLHGWQENETGHVHDGDGRPVIEKGGSRASPPAPPPMEISIFKYQVWSTVLGSSLTTVGPNGNKVATKVFAGGTHIATQIADGGEELLFHTADPVTGTTGDFAANGNFVKLEETEPLGQKIDLTDPGISTPTTYGEVHGMGKDPEWQCLKWEEFRAGGIRDLPIHCQKNIATDAKWFTEYFGESEKEESPAKISDEPSGPPTLKVAEKLSSEELSRRRALAATGKFDNEADDSGSGPNVPMTDASQADDFGGRKITRREVKKIADDIQKIFDANPDCLPFIQGILANAESPGNPIVSQNPLDVVWAVFQRGGIHYVPTKQGELDKGHAWGAISGDNTIAASITLPPTRTLQGLPGAQYSRSVMAAVNRTQELITASTVLNEAIHHSGARVYDDRDMGIAVADHLGIPRPRYGLKTHEDVSKWSNWWHPKVNNVCSISRTQAYERR